MYSNVTFRIHTIGLNNIVITELYMLTMHVCVGFSFSICLRKVKMSCEQEMENNNEALLLTTTSHPMCVLCIAMKFQWLPCVVYFFLLYNCIHLYTPSIPSAPNTLNATLQDKTKQSKKEQSKAK